MTRALIQLTLLTWKNLIVLRRNIVWTIFEMVTPLLFFLLISLIMKNITIEEKKGHRFPNLTLCGNGSDFDSAECPFSCGSREMRLLYSTGDSVIASEVDRLLQGVAERFRASQEEVPRTAWKILGKGVSVDVEVVREGRVEMEKLLIGDYKRHKFCSQRYIGGLHIDRMDVFDRKLTYQLWTPYYVNHRFTKEFEQQNSPFSFPSPGYSDQPSSIKMYCKLGTMSLQMAVNAEFSKLTGDAVDSQLGVRAFPQPDHAESFHDILLELAHFMFALSTMSIILHTAREIAAESESGMKDLLHMMGMSRGVFYVSHVLMAFAKAAIAIVVNCTPFFIFLPSISPSLLLVTALLYAMAVICMAALVAAICRSAQGAITASIILTIVLALVCLAAPARESIPFAALASLNPNQALSYAFHAVVEAVKKGDHLTWSSSFSDACLVFPVGSSIVMLVVDVFLLFGLTIVVDYYWLVFSFPQPTTRVVPAEDTDSHLHTDIENAAKGNPLFNLLTVDEHLDFFARLKSIETNHQWRGDRAELLERLQLKGERTTRSSHLSDGLRRKLCVGMALIARREGVLLDEPTTGMDPAAGRDIEKILLETMERVELTEPKHSVDGGEGQRKEEEDIDHKPSGGKFLLSVRALLWKRWMYSKAHPSVFIYQIIMPVLILSLAANLLSVPPRQDREMSLTALPPSRFVTFNHSMPSEQQKEYLQRITKMKNVNPLQVASLSPDDWILNQGMSRPPFSAGISVDADARPKVHHSEVMIHSLPAAIALVDGVRYGVDISSSMHLYKTDDSEFSKEDQIIKSWLAGPMLAIVLSMLTAPFIVLPIAARTSKFAHQTGVLFWLATFAVDTIIFLIGCAAYLLVFSVTDWLTGFYSVIFLLWLSYYVASIFLIYTLSFVFDCPSKAHLVLFFYQVLLTLAAFILEFFVHVSVIAEAEWQGVAEGAMLLLVPSFAMCRGLFVIAEPAIQSRYLRPEHRPSQWELLQWGELGRVFTCLLVMAAVSLALFIIIQQKRIRRAINSVHSAAVGGTDRGGAEDEGAISDDHSARQPTSIAV